MGSKYEWGYNPVRDSLLQMIEIGVDISGKQFKRELNQIFVYILENQLKSPEDLVYLDFKIKKTGMHYTLIGNNIVSALWFLGIMPHNPALVFDKNECHVGNITYSFDKKKKILKSTINK